MMNAERGPSMGGRPKTADCRSCSVQVTQMHTNRQSRFVHFFCVVDDDSCATHHSTFSSDIWFRALSRAHGLLRRVLGVFSPERANEAVLFMKMDCELQETIAGIQYVVQCACLVPAEKKTTSVKVSTGCRTPV